MKKNRELFIAVLYVSIFILSILNFKWIVALFVFKGFDDCIIGIFIFYILFLLACIPLSIYHLYKYVKYKTMFLKKHKIWNYSTKDWIRFVISNTWFRVKDHWKENFKFIKYITVTSILTIIVIVLTENGAKSFKSFIIWIIMFDLLLIIWPIIKAVLFFLENIVFSRNPVVLVGENCLSINGDFYYWYKGTTYSFEGITTFENELEYLFSSWNKTTGRTYKKVRIPIPKN